MIFLNEEPGIQTESTSRCFFWQKKPKPNPETGIIFLEELNLESNPSKRKLQVFVDFSSEFIKIH